MGTSCLKLKVRTENCKSSSSHLTDLAMNSPDLFLLNYNIFLPRRPPPVPLSHLFRDVLYFNLEIMVCKLFRTKESLAKTDTNFPVRLQISDSQTYEGEC